jgi:hypothetical protein
VNAQSGFLPAEQHVRHVLARLCSGFLNQRDVGDAMTFSAMLAPSPAMRRIA